MGTIIVAGKSIEVDEEGILANSSDWSEDVAKELAWRDNCELTDKHWEIIKPARAYYEKRQVTPSLYVLTKAMREKHGVGNDNLDHLLQILARLNVKRVFQYAGLPPKNTIHVSGKRIALGDRGNLKDPSDWSEDVAKALAMADDYELTKKHWDTIYRLRRFYEKHHTAQSMDAAIAAVREWLGLEFELRSSLRPGQALKYAGLPDLLVPHPRNIDVSGRQIKLDDEGYLVNPSDWSEDVTKELAWRDNCELTYKHWEVIRFVRDCYYHEEFQISPPVHLLLKAIGKKLGPDKGNVKYLYTLFPYGPAKRACEYAIKRVFQYAGLPPKNTISASGKRIALDEGGNLKEPSDWSEEVVRALAKADDFELTKKHWDTIYRLRQCYEKHHATQSMDAPTKALHEWLGLGFELRLSLRLEQALKYAGLPDLLVPYPRTITVAGKSIELDGAGYLVNASDWSEDVAKQLAWVDNCELTDNHWEVIKLVSEYFGEYQISPPNARVLAKAVANKLGPDKGNSKYLYELFPYNPAKQGCKYAGLPKPGAASEVLIRRSTRAHSRRSHMNTITVPDKTIAVDEEGYLWDPSDWNEEVAREMARSDGLELTPGHWEVINFLQENYKKQPIVFFDDFKKIFTDDAVAKAIAKTQAAANHPNRDLRRQLYARFGLDPYFYERREELLCEFTKKYSMKHLQELFPQDSARQAARYAGLTLIKKHKRTLPVTSKPIEIDEEGFLVNRPDWSDEVAWTLARADGIELTPEHWEVINFIREYNEEFQISPHWRELTKAVARKLGQDKGNSKYLYELFPYGANQANRYAGLYKQCWDP